MPLAQTEKDEIVIVIGVVETYRTASTLRVVLRDLDRDEVALLKDIQIQEEILLSRQENHAKQIWPGGQAGISESSRDTPAGD